MSYGDQLRAIANAFLTEHQEQATAREIAAWAINNGHWHPQPSDYIDQCADQIAKAMREDYYRDPQGRTVRTKHAARISSGEHQLTFWADIRSGPREHIQTALQQRRHQIVGECCQLKTDVDSFNDNRSQEQPIQISLNFTLDVEEWEAAAGF
jgi:hypothetical protein